MDAESHANSTDVYKLLRGRLRGTIGASHEANHGADPQKLQNPISPEILRIVASRVIANDRNDHLLLPEAEEVGPYELPLPREVNGLETYVPAYLNVSHLRRLAALVA